jgi:hypothetical protein
VKFPLYLRVPRWCSEAKIMLNGQPLRVESRPLIYIVVERSWKNGDTIRLELPMHLGLHKWKKNSNSVSIDYGPLSFSLRIGERWADYGNDKSWPESQVYPTTAWNYGLALDAVDPVKSLEIVKKTGPLPSQPFTPETVPIEIRAHARKIPAWKQEANGLVGKLQSSPVKSQEPLETVSLIPMGAARLSITSFPVIGNGPDAHEWAASNEQPTPPSR